MKMPPAEGLPPLSKNEIAGTGSQAKFHKLVYLAAQSHDFTE